MRSNIKIGTTITMPMPTAPMYTAGFSKGLLCPEVSTRSTFTQIALNPVNNKKVKSLNNSIELKLA